MPHIGLLPWLPGTCWADGASGSVADAPRARGTADLTVSVEAEPFDAPPCGSTDRLLQLLVFDAGSSGTRIHVFNISPTADGKAHVPFIDGSVRQTQTLKVKPGLSDFAERDDIEGAEKHIMRLLDFANQFVPDSRRPSTPILLKATAGLRSVSEGRADAVLEALRRMLGATGYLFRPEWADIIDGKEEAGLAWVTANYLQGAFHVEGVETVGVIEMGGGSTQVVFEAPPSSELHPDDNFVFSTLQGKTYRLYAHSYFGFGQDHAQATMQSLFGAAEVDPCYPKGYARSVTVDGAPTLVRGSGDGLECITKIRSQLWPTSADAPGRYANERPLSGRFVATENFFHMQAGAGLGWEDRAVSLDEYRDSVQKVCATDLPDEGDRAEPHDAGGTQHCFGLAYQAALLQAVSAVEAAEVSIKRRINGGDIDWALGAALVHHMFAS